MFKVPLSNRDFSTLVCGTMNIILKQKWINIGHKALGKQHFWNIGNSFFNVIKHSISELLSQFLP